MSTPGCLTTAKRRAILSSLEGPVRQIGRQVKLRLYLEASDRGCICSEWTKRLIKPGYTISIHHNAVIEQSILVR